MTTSTQSSFDGDVFFLIYVSRFNKETTNQKALTDIYHSSQRNNQRTGVTGVLLFGRGCFCQYIEGEESQIKKLYATICEDDRHRAIKLVDTGYKSARLFGEWHMHFLAFDNLSLHTNLPKAITQKPPCGWSVQETHSVVDAISDYHTTGRVSSTGWQDKTALKWYDFWTVHQNFLVLQACLLFALVVMGLWWWLFG